MLPHLTTPKPEDWKIIQRLNNEVFQNDKENDPDIDLEWPFSERGISYYKKLADGSYGQCYIALVNDEPVGYIALSIKDFGYRKSKYVEIENIGVSPEYRSQGIGKVLVDAAIGWAKANQITKLYVAAYWNNKKAVQFYKKIGFTEMGIELDMDINP